MTGQKTEPRLFIQTDPAHACSKITRWAEIKLTRGFVSRVLGLHRLLDEHRLFQVTTEFDVKWCLAEGWQIDGSFGAQDSWLDVWSDGFTLKSHICRIDDQSGKRRTSVPVEVSYFSRWQFSNDFDREDLCDRGDYLVTAQGLTECTPGEPDWEIAFAHDLNAHLTQNGEPPLNV